MIFDCNFINDKAAIDKSSANGLSTLSQQKLKLAAQALMATLDEVQPHQISLESSVVLESPRARMLSQYLYGTETPDSANIVHEVQYRTEVARCNAYGLLSTAAQPASV